MLHSAPFCSPRPPVAGCIHWDCCFQPDKQGFYGNYCLRIVTNVTRLSMRNHVWEGSCEEWEFRPTGRVQLQRFWAGLYSTCSIWRIRKHTQIVYSCFLVTSSSDTKLIFIVYFSLFVSQSPVGHRCLPTTHPFTCTAPPDQPIWGFRPASGVFPLSTTSATPTSQQMHLTHDSLPVCGLFSHTYLHFSLPGCLFARVWPCLYLTCLCHCSPVNRRIFCPRFRDCLILYLLVWILKVVLLTSGLLILLSLHRFSQSYKCIDGPQR